LGLPDSTGGFYVPLIARATAAESGLGFGYRLRLATGGSRDQKPVLPPGLRDPVPPHGAPPAGAPPPPRGGEPTPPAAGAGAGSAESYDVVIPGSPTRAVTEKLSVAWFATGGSFSEDVTSPDKPDTKLRLDARVPPPGTTMDLWIVAHDERGGADFRHRTLLVQ